MITSGCGGEEDRVAAVADRRPDCLAVPAKGDAEALPGGSAGSAWRAFRTLHPYPYQAFAGRKLASDKAVLVISEPPPDIEQKAALEFVEELFADRAPQIDIRRTMIGSDGYVEDLVVGFDAPELKSNDLLSDADLRDRIGLLHAAWFGTSCGGDVETIGVKAAPPQPIAPDLQISPGELGAWLADPATTWSEIEGEAPVFGSFADLDAGAFRSSDGSMVLFTLPLAALDDAGQLAGFRTSFRRFAVSSDAILGASWTPEGKLALVGRRRTHPLSDIPPLRFETFALIAAQHSSELAQSYERTNPLAGRMETQRDWAPIFLSDALIDTEFGELLNVTDQMLKSWSNAGQVHYLHFDYPRVPRTFPFGSTPLFEVVRKETQSNSVLYNWNTAGLGMVFEQPTNTIFAARRLGALPVTYGASAEGGKMDMNILGRHEETAYNYFASLGDPNLARVVQYTLIYQAITAAREAIGAEAATDGDKSVPATADRALIEQMRPLLATLRSPDWQALLAAQEDKSFSEELKRGLDAYSALRSRLSEDQILAALANRNALNDILNDMSFEALTAAGGEPVDQIDYRLEQLGSAIKTVAYDRRMLSSAKAKYEAASARPQRGWIRTPSVVVSWRTGSTSNVVGGHNLDTRVVRFQEASDVSGVEYSEGVIRYNPSEAARVGDSAGDLARAVEHGGARSPEELARVLEGAARTPKTRFAALELDAPNAPRPVARLGARTFETDAQFVRSLEAMKQKAPCCRVLGRNEQGEALLVETNAVPPPVFKTTTFGDNVSLGSYLRKNGTPDVIMLDQPAGHIRSLLVSAVDPQASVSPFQAMRQRVRGLFRSTPERGDHVIGVDLNGREGSVLVRSEPGLSVEQRLGRLAEAQAQRVSDLRLQRIGPENMQAMLGDLAWSPARDGLPTGMRVSFASDGGAKRGFINVIIGRRQPDVQRTRRVEQTVQNTIASAKAEASLIQLQMTIQNDLRALNDADLGRIAVFVDRGRIQTTFRLDPKLPRRG